MPNRRRKQPKKKAGWSNDVFDEAALLRKEDAPTFFVDAPSKKKKITGPGGKKLAYADRVLQANANAKPIANAPKLSERRLMAPLKLKMESKAGRIVRQKAQDTKQSKQGVYDIWATPEPTPDELNDFLQVGIKKPAKAPETFKKPPTLIKAIDPLDTGLSYRPTYEAHQDVLGEAVAEELKKRDEARLLDQKLQIHWDIINEFKLKKKGNNQLEDGDEEQQPPPVKPKKKQKLTQSERNRKKRARQAAAQLAEKRALKAWRRDFDRLKGIMGEIKDEEEASQQRIKEREEKEKERPYKTPRLGKHKFEEGPKEVLLTEELPERLRQLETKGDLIKDRFKSFMRRGFFAPTVKARVFRKYNLKVYERHSARVELPF